jgi:integrase
VFLGADEEGAIRAALPEALRPLFTVSINTGLRWSEQASLEWRDVDLLSGFLTVRLSKNGSTRRVALNSVARAALVDAASRRKRPSDPEEPVFTAAYRTTARALENAVEAAMATLTASARDTSRLIGYSWHGNRHGGWRTLSMVQRYAHLAPEQLVAAVERMVVAATERTTIKPAGSVASEPELRRIFGETADAAPERHHVVS